MSGYDFLLPKSSEAKNFDFSHGDTYFFVGVTAAFEINVKELLEGISEKYFD